MIDRNNFGENLSNVYIRNIEIKNLNNIEGDNSLKIKIDFCVYDYYDSKTASKYLPNSKSSKRIAFLISKSKEKTIVKKIIDALYEIKGAYSFGLLTNKKLIGTVMDKTKITRK